MFRFWKTFESFTYSVHSKFTFNECHLCVELKLYFIIYCTEMCFLVVDLKQKIIF